MAVTVKTKSGKRLKLLNPAEKGNRFAKQLKSGRITETGKRLNESEKSFRAGYLTARSDNAKAYNSRKSARKKNTIRRYK